MSGSVPPTPPAPTAPAVVTTTPPVTATDSLRNPTFIIAVLLLVIGAGTIAAIFWKGSSEVQAGMANLVIGACIVTLANFYFGSSKGSQLKDASTTTMMTTAPAPVVPPVPPPPVTPAPVPPGAAP